MGNPLKSRVYKFFGRGVAGIPKILKKGGGQAGKLIKDASGQKLQPRKKGSKSGNQNGNSGILLFIYIFIFISISIYLSANSCISLRAVTLHIISMCNSLHSIFD